MIFASEDVPRGMWEVFYALGLLLAGSGVPWLWKQVRELRDTNNATATTQNDKLIARMDRERVEILDELRKTKTEQDAKEVDCQKRLDKLSADLGNLRVEHERAVSWIEHLQYQLGVAKIPFRSWKDTPVPPQIQAAISGEKP
jgi:hypothetical protein